MTNLTRKAVFAISLSLLSASFLIPSASAQTQTETTSTTTATKAPAKKVKAKKAAKLKKAATNIIKNGVEDANAKVTGK